MQRCGQSFHMFLPVHAASAFECWMNFMRTALVKHSLMSRAFLNQNTGWWRNSFTELVFLFCVLLFIEVSCIYFFFPSQVIIPRVLQWFLKRCTISEGWASSLPYPPSSPIFLNGKRKTWVLPTLLGDVPLKCKHPCWILSNFVLSFRFFHCTLA